MRRVEVVVFVLLHDHQVLHCKHFLGHLGQVALSKLVQLDNPVDPVGGEVDPVLKDLNPEGFTQLWFQLDNKLPVPSI